MNVSVKRPAEDARLPESVELSVATVPLAEEPAVLSSAEREVSSVHGGLGQTTARGAGVTLAAQGARFVLQLGSVAVLARLLSPRDYGLLAIGLVVVGIGEIVRDVGLSSAALRAPELSTRQRDGLFWLNTAAGLVLTAVAVAVAGPVAAAFSEPELEPIVRVLAVTFVLNGLAAQYRAGLSRDLRFAALAGSELATQVVALTAAVTAAALGAGYWALVAQQVTQGVITVVTLVALGRWLPGRPRRGASLRPFIRFGAGITGTQIVYYLGSNLDNLILGLWVGPTALGLYNRGYQLLMTPLNQLRSPATALAVPVLARLHDDPDRFADYLKRSQLALGYPLAFGLALVAGAAAPVVELVLGDQWKTLAPVLALLAVAGGAQTLAFVGHWVYLARGLAGALLRFHLVTLVLSAACIAAGSGFGVVGVAAGYAVAALLEWPLSLWWLSRATVVPVQALLRGAVRVTACAATAGAACYTATQLTASLLPLWQIFAGVLMGTAVPGLLLVVPAIRRDLRGVANWASHMVAIGR
jgi:PST family polysaccharide transporter